MFDMDTFSSMVGGIMLGVRGLSSSEHSRSIWIPEVLRNVVWHVRSWWAGQDVRGWCLSPPSCHAGTHLARGLQSHVDMAGAPIQSAELAIPVECSGLVN